MKRILTILIVCAFWTVIHAQAKSDSEHDRLSGAVQSVKTEIVEFTARDDKNVEGPRMPVQTITYNAHGNRMKRVDFNRDGSVAQTLVYSYDAEGRSTGYDDYMPGLSTARRHIYVLDQSGRRIEYRIVQPTGSAGDEKYLYTYDANGNRVTEELYHKTTLIGRNENTYDSQGRLISQIIYNPDGSISARINNSIAADGKPTQRIRYDGDLLTYKVLYTYDSKGRLTTLETVGSFVETDSSAEGFVTGKMVHVYKGKDQPKETLIYNQDGSLRERIVSDYDSRGNWTKRTRYLKAAPMQVEYRTITYQ